MSAHLPDGICIREVQPRDRDQWAALFRGYRDFYELAPDDTVIDTVWEWVNDPHHELNALVAVHEGQPVGIAHWRRFSRPSHGASGLFLDDLYLAPEMRGEGIGTALISRLHEIAAAEGHIEVRWITSQQNLPAQRLYDRIALRTPFLTYVDLV